NRDRRPGQIGVVGVGDGQGRCHRERLVFDVPQRGGLDPGQCWRNLDDRIDSQAVLAGDSGRARPADLQVIRSNPPRLRNGRVEGVCGRTRGEQGAARVEQTQLGVQVVDVVKDVQLNRRGPGPGEFEVVKVSNLLDSPGRGVDIAGRGEDCRGGPGPAVVV